MRLTDRRRARCLTQESYRRDKHMRVVPGMMDIADRDREAMWEAPACEQGR
jgi:hypothetical protein